MSLIAQYLTAAPTSKACFDQAVFLVVSKSFQDLIRVVLKLESTMQLVIDFGFHSSSMKDADHDASGWPF